MLYTVDYASFYHFIGNERQIGTVKMSDIAIYNVNLSQFYFYCTLL